jgi:hypothetical protein
MRLPCLSEQGWYANCLWAGDPLDPNFVIIGGLDLYRTTDGGLTYTKISDWQQSPKSAHADHHAIVAHPAYDGASNKTVFFGNDGGLYRADDATAVTPDTGWMNLNNGLGITELYGAATNLASGKMVAGAQDNGTLLYTPTSVPPSPATGPNGWVSIYGGDGGYAAVHPAQPRFYGEYVYLQLHRGDGITPSQDIYSNLPDAGDQRNRSRVGNPGKHGLFATLKKRSV